MIWIIKLQAKSGGQWTGGPHAIAMLLGDRQVDCSMNTHSRAENIRPAVFLHGDGQMRTSDLATLRWPILVFDSTKAQPLPLETKWHRLDLSRASESDLQEILLIYLDMTKPLASVPYVANTTVSTTVNLIGPPDRRLLQYRHLFVQCTNNDPSIGISGISFSTISLNHEYFEDEYGRPVSGYDIVRQVSGNPEPIILGDPYSVLRLGPSDFVNNENWSVQSANCIATFLRVVMQIEISEWLRGKVSLTVEEREPDSRVIAADFPGFEGTRSVVPLFRQLYSNDSSDDLFNRSCNIYLRHVGDERKKEWMLHQRAAFNEALDAPPLLMAEIGVNTRSFMNTVLYGTNLIHSRPKDKSDEYLRELINRHGDARIAHCFHASLRSIY